jgi:hypothetical protein
MRVCVFRSHVVCGVLWLQAPVPEELSLSVGRASELACVALATLGQMALEFIRGMRQPQVRRPVPLFPFNVP